MIEVRKEFCPKNHRCPTMNICPVGAIVQESPFSAPNIDEEICTDCGICTTSCRVFKQN
ncbi:4Fe-4S ferredoxin [Candidatus Cloacimonadota bacterium]